MKRKFTDFTRLNYNGFARVTDKENGKGWLYKGIKIDADTLQELKAAKNVTFVICKAQYVPELKYESVILWNKCIKCI